MKYTLVGSGLEFQNNQLIYLYRQYRFLIISAYSYESILEILERDGLISGDLEDDEKRDLVLDAGTVEENERLKKFMKTLDREIQEKMKPVPTSLSPI